MTPLVTGQRGGRAEEIRFGLGDFGALGGHRGIDCIVSVCLSGWLSGSLSAENSRQAKEWVKVGER